MKFAVATLLTLSVFASAGAQAPDTPPSFADWLAAVRTEALGRGIRADIVDEALAHIDEPVPVVIERDRSQAETILTLETYISRHVTPSAVRTGREMLVKHRELLERVHEKYGIAPAMLLAIWGAESNFGQFSGVRPTVAALATLAWDPRRSAFFRGELFDALEILNRGDIEFEKMQGSWAGAMGQPQFMPSSYLKYAEDFDGDGRRDIWGSPADVFASIANYLNGYGWTANEGWGREVKVPPAAAHAIAEDVARRDGTCQATRDMSIALPVSKWRELGVLASNGTRLPATAQQASLVSGTTRHFLVYHNYDVLLEYNCAHAYAVSVALMADQLTLSSGSPGSPGSPPAKPRTPASKK